MTIETILVCGNRKPTPDDGVAMIHVTNLAAAGEPPVEVHQGMDGFHSVTIIRAGHGGDIAAVLNDRLTSLDFDSHNDMTVAIYSDCKVLSSYDVAYIAHIDMPQAAIETQNGDRVIGFKTVTRPIIDDEFESGGMAALDGVPIEANPHQVGSIAHDKWMSGHQAHYPEAMHAH